MPADFMEKYFEWQKDSLDELITPELNRQVKILYDAWKEDKQVFIIGNGGSASTASHFACDLGKGAAIEGKRRFRIMSLNDNMAVFSAYANDNGYEHVFSEQLINVLNPGDVVIGITVSGNSPNILRAMEYARKMGAITLGWIGCDGGKLKGMVDSALTLTSSNFGVVEGAHVVLHHAIAQQFMDILGQHEDE